MNTYALDYESYYDKDCSIKKLGPMGYFNHPNFDAYLMSVVGDEGTKWVGHPKDFDWEKLKGQRVLSHNASFDETLYLLGVKKKWWPNVDYAEWHCTADMAAFCGLPRSLKGATTELFDLEVDKSTRDNMNGKSWQDMPEDFKKEVSEYALKDSELCLRLWEALEKEWPQREKDISVAGRRIVQRGIPIDLELLKKQKESVSQLLFDSENRIPWIEEAPPLSRKAFNEECRRLNIEPPASLALSSEEANEWINKYGKEYAWIESVRDYRRINALKRKLEAFDYATLSDSRFYGGLMYHGAHTGRWSGSGGNLNLQNLPRGDLFGTNLRSLISPKPGNKLIVADLSQIEVRTLAWLSKDKAALHTIETSADIYEGFAIHFRQWDPKGDSSLKDKDPSLRHKVKQMVLGCGYGASPAKFAIMSGLPLWESKISVMIYRKHMGGVVKFWNELSRKMHMAYSKGEELVFPLPSGRSLNYGKITTALQKGKRNYISMVTKGSKKIPVRLWGGLLAENLSQALARCIFADMLLRVESLGLKIIFHVHDELIIECKEGDAEETLRSVIESMSTPPDWIPDIPLKAEGKILDRYEK
tara:strand:- start:15249 stop:17012 length:1764 start_codon:yes stop_codon:yes gene_type:complete